MKKFFSSIPSKIQERKVYTRLITIICLVIAFIGLCGPFIRLQFSASFVGPFGTPLLSLNHVEAGTVSLRNFADFSTIGEMEFFGEKIEDQTIGGINIYKTLKNPPKSRGYLDAMINTLDPETLGFLSSADLEKRLVEIFPKYGGDIFRISSALGKTLTEGRGIMIAANNILHKSEAAIQQASDRLNQAEEYKQKANIVVLIFFLLAVIPIILLCIPKIPGWVARIFCYLCGAIILLLCVGIGMGMPYVDNSIQQWLGEVNTSLHTHLVTFLKGVLGSRSGILELFGGTNQDYLRFTPEVSLSWGAILALSAFIASIILSYFIPKRRRKP